MKIFEGKNVPIKSWCDNPEQEAIDQAYNLSSLPFIFKQVALMPDTHAGYGMPIGGVIACKNAIIPNAVGVDIGCGMIAVQTNFNASELDKDIIKKILGQIRTYIPVGFNRHKTKQKWERFDKAPNIPIITKELQASTYQLGTLGGGNHFIEIQKDNNGFVWFMIHSGSRNFGYKIAKEYNKKAQELCKLWYSNIPPLKGEDGLAFLPIGTKEAQEYIEAMNFALQFALQNRKQMMNKVFASALACIKFNAIQEINIHHNYATLENHFGNNVWIHRKGATSAKKGQLGIIPGSQGTASYIVKGKGNIESFMSCSHGAGRKMSRTKARRTLNLEEEVKKLNEKNIVHGIRTEKDLDEASSAYKDIDIVMEEQQDLVEILFKLTPLAVIKG